jgi:hypothetical protein
MKALKEQYLIAFGCGLFLLLLGEQVLGQRVYGKIGEKYSALGGVAGPLGAATSDEASAPYGGRFNLFQNGYIYWHPEIGTAYAVWGAIGAKWNQAGRVQFGYPITDETATPDGRGRYNHFRVMHQPGRPEASIYWTPQSGAYLAYGEIRKAWAAAGWERSIGFPTSDEFQWGKYRRSNFERGYIKWSADEGAHLIHSGDAILRNVPPGTFGTILVNGIELAVDNKLYYWNSTILSENTACLDLDARRGQIETSMKDMIRDKVNPTLGKFSIHSNAQMHLSPDCSFRADTSASGSRMIRVQTFIPGNSFNFQVTTPTILGSGFDPKFSLTFDLSTTSTVTIPASPAGLFNVSPTQVFLSNVKLDSHNVTGDLALAVKNIYRFFTGTDLTAVVTQNRSFDLPALQTGLANFSSQIRRIPTQYRIETSLTPGDMFRINGTGQPPPRPPVIH